MISQPFDTVAYALGRLSLPRPSWKTLVVSATRDLDLPPDRVWNTWSKLESWPEWSTPLHEATRWTGTPGWTAGATFEQTLRLGFPVGKSVNAVTVGAAEPGRMVSWWNTEGGMRSCHVWRFSPLAQEGTRVTDTEVFDGVLIGLLKPLLRGSWQRRFEASVAGLVRATAGD
ncbi:MAG: SRPBCC family protein [Candidatus Dormibacteraeota bacterium]|nr:SRPBCC family protein [Candidatus Dormibacteraeota bacterium]